MSVLSNSLAWDLNKRLWMRILESTDHSLRVRIDGLILLRLGRHRRRNWLMPVYDHIRKVRVR